MSEDGTAALLVAAVAVKHYSLLRAPMIGSKNFTLLASNILATNAATAFTDTNAPITGAGFYRVRVNP